MAELRVKGSASSVNASWNCADDIDEPIYSNSFTDPRIRLASLPANTSRESIFPKKKPKPAPKPGQMHAKKERASVDAPCSKVVTDGSRTRIDVSRKRQESSNNPASDALLDDECIYDDVFFEKRIPEVSRKREQPPKNPACSDENVVKKPPRSHVRAPVLPKAKSTAIVETAEPLYSEAGPVADLPAVASRPTGAKDINGFSAVLQSLMQRNETGPQGDANSKPSTLKRPGKQNPVTSVSDDSADSLKTSNPNLAEVSPRPLPRTNARAAKKASPTKANPTKASPAKLSAIQTSTAANRASEKEKVEASLYDDAEAVRLEHGREELGNDYDGSLYDVAREVDTCVVKNDKRKCTDEPNAVYDNPIAVNEEEFRALHDEDVSLQRRDLNNVYEDAIAVRGQTLDTLCDKVVQGQDVDNVYEDAITVHRQKLNSLYSDSNSIQKQNSDNVYEDAITVHKQKLNTLYANTGTICKQKSNDLYDNPIVVHDNEELNMYEDADADLTRPWTSEPNADADPIYDEASTVTRPAIKLERKDHEEQLYDTASAVKLERIDREDQLYDTASAVDNSRLPVDEDESHMKKSEVIYRNRRAEDPYRRAASVRGSFREDSSDEEEPTYYNLLLVKMSMQRSNRLFYSKLDSPLTMEKFERKACRLSRYWGDSSGKLTEIRPVEHHQAVKAVKSDTFLKTIPVEGEDYQVDDVDNETESFLSPVNDGDRAIMRKWILTHILDSEKSYVAILDLLFEHMQTFKSIANSEKSVIQARDNAVIFYRIPELHRSHYQFVNCLGRTVETGSGDQEVGAIFRHFVEQEYVIAKDYLKNYQEAVKTIHRCWTESPLFADLTKLIPVKSGNSLTNLSVEDLLHKPIVRFQQNALSMKDLIKSTPVSHPDYDVLQRALKLALNSLGECSGDGLQKPSHLRYLVKHSLLIEKVENLRKLRHIFLFSDVIICAKQKLYSRRRNLYETKWFIPLQDFLLDEKFSAKVDEKSAILHQGLVDDLEKDLLRLQSEMKNEMKRSKKFRSSDGQQQNRKIEGLQKKIFQQEAALLEAMPYLELKISDKTFNSEYTLMMSSDYERTTWKEVICGIAAKVEKSAPRITAPEVTSLLQSQKLPKAIGSVLTIQHVSLEKERLSGCLKMTIHKLQGLTEEAETFCSVEIDSFGHFFTKATTQRCQSREPAWEEEFDIDLEGAQTLHLMCYRIGKETDQLLGKCALELNTAWLSEEFKSQSVPLTGQLAITISLCYTPQDKLIRRSTCVKKGMFGVQLQVIARREHRLIPLIVTSCIEEIEARGLDELGIYRVSGLASQVEQLKSAFNNNSFTAVALLKDADINIVTSLLKQFFRELPESLFTDAAYQQLVKGIGLADPEAKEKFLVRTLNMLPRCNYATAMFVLNHLIRVYQNKEKNKMTLENLATVFGPTLLHPAELERNPMTMEQRLWMGTNDIAAQATIMLFFLKLKANNYVF